MRPGSTSSRTRSIAPAISPASARHCCCYCCYCCCCCCCCYGFCGCYGYCYATTGTSGSQRRTLRRRRAVATGTAGFWHDDDAARGSEEQHYRSDSGRTTVTLRSGSSAAPPLEQGRDTGRQSRNDGWGRTAPVNATKRWGRELGSRTGDAPSGVVNREDLQIVRREFHLTRITTRTCNYAEFSRAISSRTT